MKHEVLTLSRRKFDEEVMKQEKVWWKKNKNFMIWVIMKQQTCHNEAGKLLMKYEIVCWNKFYEAIEIL